MVENFLHNTVGKKRKQRRLGDEEQWGTEIQKLLCSLCVTKRESCWKVAAIANLFVYSKNNLSVHSLQVASPFPSLTPNKASPEKSQDTKHASTDSQAEQKPQELKIKIDASAVPDDVMKLVLQYLKDLHVEENTKANETIISIWDFAGQHMYHTSHSVFLSHRALYSLFSLRGHVTTSPL